MRKHRPSGSGRTAFSAHALGRISRRYLRPAAVWAAAILVGALVVAGPQTSVPAARAASCANPVACENQLPGTPQSTWDMSSSQGGTIQGFADPFSVNVGNTINFKVQSAASSYKIDIYRIGYYGGDGARLVTTLSSPNITTSQNQPACNTTQSTGLVDCGNWGVSASWAVPATTVSGMYIADLVRTDGTSDMNQIPFVVANNASTAQIVMMTNDETWQAYNAWGGYSFYSGNSTGSPWCCTSAIDPGRAVQLSYNRPITTRFNAVNAGGPTYFYADEYPMIRFLEENGYDVSYASQSDVGASGGAAMLEQHKMFLTAGHSEYWDPGDRNNVTAARNAGVNVAFFSGNNMTWKTRWAASQFGNEANRTLVLYKESWDNARTDPQDPPTWTGYWRDPRFSPPADGGKPENALTGQIWGVDCCNATYSVPGTYSKLQIWRNTAVANLSSSQTYTMPTDTLGYEWDVPVDNGFQPAGEIKMSQTCATVPQFVLDIESDTGSRQACNSLTMYKAGGLVFDAGSIQWAWGLDSRHDGEVPANTPDPVMQQVTVNVLADMGAQPTTLISGLVAGNASTDTTAPTSTITAPSAGASIANGSTVTISGTAADAGGGVVAGVEVSTDGGSTWHPVTTISTPNTSVTWSYTWSAAGSGSVKILSRATDDSANMETPGAGVSVTVNCPCGLFGASYAPSVTAVSDSTAVEVGVKFQSSISGWANGVRFYKGAGNTGTHTGSLWSSTGTLLATGTFSNETASGWQSLQFANPVQIGPNTTYVVSYFAPNGHYAMDQDLYDLAYNTPPLTALKSDYTTTGGGNGVFNTGGPGFPTSTFEGSSYGVDVIFATTGTSSPPTVLSSTPVSGSSSNPVTTAPTVTFSQAVVPSSVSFTVKDSGGNTVAGTTSLGSGNTVATFTPSSQLAAGTTYTVTVSGAQNSTGQTLASPYSYTFISSKSFPVACPCAVWPDVAPSGATDPTDSSPNNIGVRFKASRNGTITGIRFYKEPDNTGTRTGTLWSSTGTQLATGTFTSEPTRGWAELDFTTPVSITAGTTYVASYQTQTGHYAITLNGLASPVTNGPLTASTGVYAYGSSNTFPTNTYSNSNFWVDVVFQ